MKEFKNYPIRRGLTIADCPSGSDCFLISYIDSYENLNIMAASADQLYRNKEHLGLKLERRYISRTGADWKAKIIKQADKVTIFKVNSYRVDINGPIGLQFVETRYGNDDFQIFLPYNYTEDVIDPNYPAFIMNKKLRRVIACNPESIKDTIKNCHKYFKLNESGVTKIKIGCYSDFTVIDDRKNKTPWGSFEHPSKELMILIRLLIEAKFLNPIRINCSRTDIFTMAGLGLEKESKNVYNFEVINGEIKQFTKYTADLWVEIPIDYSKISLIKLRKQLKYLDGNHEELVADVLVKVNAPDEGVFLIGFNLEENYVFQTKIFNILDWCQNEYQNIHQEE